SIPCSFMKEASDQLNKPLALLAPAKHDERFRYWFLGTGDEAPNKTAKKSGSLHHRPGLSQQVYSTKCLPQEIHADQIVHVSTLEGLPRSHVLECLASFLMSRPLFQKALGLPAEHSRVCICD